MEVASNQTVNALNNNNKQIPHNILFRHTHKKLLRAGQMSTRQWYLLSKWFQKNE